MHSNAKPYSSQILQLMEEKMLQQNRKANKNAPFREPSKDQKGAQKNET
jgi:hypothetical protein